MLSLSRNLATRAHYPAIDVLESVSRSMLEVTTSEHRILANKIRSILATYRDAEDLINIGAYVAGTNKDIDEALRLMPKIKKFLIQDLYEKVVWEQIKTLMKEAIS